MITSDIQKSDPGVLITLYQLELDVDTIYYLHPGLNAVNQPIVWDTKTYSPFPLEASGFEVSSSGTLPRPTVRIANINIGGATGLIGALVRDNNDLIGCKFTRIRTFQRYLDGEPGANPAQKLPDDIFYIDRKVTENPVFIEFELASSLDLNGVKLPRRQIIQNTCTWRYKSPECTWTLEDTLTPVKFYNSLDVEVFDSTLDSCGKRLSSCKARFGETAILPYGGFPGCGRY